MKPVFKLMVVAAPVLIAGCQSHTKVTPARSEAASRSISVEMSRDPVPPAPPSPGQRATTFYVEAPK